MKGLRPKRVLASGFEEYQGALLRGGTCRESSLKSPVHFALLSYLSPAASVDFTGGSDGKESACDARDLDLIPGLGRSSREGNDYPLQYSCLENSVAYWATVHGVAKSWT